MSAGGDAPTRGAEGDAEVRLLDRRVLHRARKFTLVEERLVLPPGREVVREVVRHPGAAVIVPVLPDGRILLVRVWRHAAAARLLEVPAGTIDAGESPAECAARELEEETGHVAGSMTPLGSWYPSPGVLDETMHLFRADDLRPSTSRPDDDEFLEPVAMAPGELLVAARDGTLRDGKTLLALFLAGVLAVLPRGGPRA